MESAGVRAIPIAAGRDATGEHPPLVAATRTSSARPFQFLGQAPRTFPKTWHLAGETDRVALQVAEWRNRGRSIQTRSGCDPVETKALPMAIHHLLGELVEKQPTRVVIDVGGVGYELIVPLSSHACLPDVGATARILTVEQHRDDVRLLFGFATDAERRMFRLLTTVSGVGPKLAIATLGHLAVDRLAGCILAGDTAAIRKIPGVGQKLADRIVLELRNSITVAAGVTGPARPTAAVGDAEAALVSLGYRPEDARRLVDAALRKHPDQSDDVEALIRLDLEAARLAQEQASREIPPAPAAVLANQQAEYVPVGSAGTGQLVVINNPPMRLWSPGLAAALSFLVPGLGQLYKGQIISGILWFLFVCMGYAALVVPGLILHFFCVLGALSGNPWTEGKTTVVRQ